MYDTVIFQLKEFFSEYPLKTYEKGERIVRPEEIIPGVFFLATGFIKQSSISKDGKELILNIYDSESPLFLILSLENRKSPYFFEALTHVEIYCAPFEKTINFLLKRPKIMLHLLKRASTSINTLNDRMESLAFSNARGKIATILLILCQRFGQRKNGFLIIPFILTHADISNLVGLTRETTSIEIKALENESIIYCNRKQIKVLNLNKIRQLASIEPKMG